MMNRAAINIHVQSFSMNRSFTFSRVNAQEYRVSGSHGRNLISRYESSRATMPLCIPASDEGDFRLLHILFSTWYGPCFLLSHSNRCIVAQVGIYRGKGVGLPSLWAHCSRCRVMLQTSMSLVTAPPNPPCRQLGEPALVSFWPSFIIWRRMGREREGQKERQLQSKGAVCVITSFSLLLPSFSHAPFLLSPQWKMNRGCDLLLLIQIDVYPEEDKTHFTSLSSGGRGKGSQTEAEIVTGSVVLSRSLCHQLWTWLMSLKHQSHSPGRSPHLLQQQPKPPPDQRKCVYKIRWRGYLFLFQNIGRKYWQNVRDGKWII